MQCNCNANSSASSASHHTLFVQRQEQATGERLPPALGHYSKRQHLEPRFSAFFDLFFCHLLALLLLFLSASGISSIPILSHPFLRGPAPRQRYSSRPTASLPGPLPQTAHDPLCCLRIHRVRLALFAVGRSCCWRVSFLFRAHRGGVESRQSLRECQQKTLLLLRELPERISKKRKNSKENSNKRAAGFQLTIAETGTGTNQTRRNPSIKRQRSSLRHSSPSISTCKPGVRALLQRWPAICLNCPQTHTNPKLRPCLVAPTGGDMVDETSPEPSM